MGENMRLISCLVVLITLLLLLAFWLSTANAYDCEKAAKELKEAGIDAKCVEMASLKRHLI